MHEWVLFMTMGYKIYIMLGAHFSGNVNILCPMKLAHKLTTRAYIYIKEHMKFSWIIEVILCTNHKGKGGGLGGVSVLKK